MKEMRPETRSESVAAANENAHERQGNRRQYRIEKSVRGEEIDERREEKEKEKILRDRRW
jgi:hypothetical protein